MARRLAMRLQPPPPEPASCRLRGVRLGASALLALLLVVGGEAHAQVIRDGTVGAAPAGPVAGGAGADYLIGPALGQAAGANLFHSFSLFDVGAGEIARFTGAGFDHVIARVTGGAASAIDGTIESTVPGASLFLLNPAGILFGADAAIDVDGDFLASTADFLRLADGTVFSAMAEAGPVLSAAVPAAFGFLGNPAGIRVEAGGLEGVEGATFGLVGGRLQLDGAGIEVENGVVQLVSVASAGEASLVDGQPIDVGSFATLGAIEITGGTEISVGGDPGGRVIVRGGTLDVNGAEFSAENEGAGDAPGIGIDVVLRDAARFRGETGLSTSTTGGGAGADLWLQARLITLAEDAELLADTEAGGDAGDVWVVGETVRLSDDAEVASDVESGSGRGGTVRIRAVRLELSGSPEISTDTNPGSTGAGGRVDIAASQLVRIAVRPEPGEQAGILTNSEGSGSAGSILIETDRLEVDGDGAVITARSEGSGRGGDVDVAARRIRLTNGARISARSTGSGDAGNVRIRNADVLELANAEISTESLQAFGGNIDIQVRSLIDLLRSGITTSVRSGVGNGGNIHIDPVHLVLDQSFILAQADSGNGGNLTILTEFLFASPDSRIDASSRLGVDGTVNSQAPDVDIAGTLSALSAVFLDAGALIDRGCGSRGGEAHGSFAVALRAGLSRAPDGYLEAPLAGPGTLQRSDGPAQPGRGIACGGGHPRPMDRSS